VGSVITTFEDACPTGYLELDGSAISRTTYARLFGKYWIKYGSGDGSTTFNLPDVRGRFLRAWSHGQTTDPDKATRTDRGDGTTGDNVGTKQSHQFYSHTHSLTANSYMDNGIGYTLDDVGTFNYNYSTPSVVATGGNETRPVNINVLYCVKY
jgi:microcystin-dependent protein